MGESPHGDPLIALGERILAELDDSRTNSTLARWLSHHTARLIREADAACESGAPDADACTAKAREAILQLWQARSTWPSGWPPPRAAEMTHVLESLPDLNEGLWYRKTLLAHLQDLHYHILAMLVDIAVADDDAEIEIEQGWLDQFGERLTPDEAAMLRHVANRPRRIDSLLRWLDVGSGSHAKRVRGHVFADESRPQAHPLLDLANAYHAAIVDLIQPTAAEAAACDEDGADQR